MLERLKISTASARIMCGLNSLTATTGVPGT